MENNPSPAHPVAPDTIGAASANPEPKARHNGWSRDKMQRFIELLVESGSVTQAAKGVGMSRNSAYRIRARLVGQPFDLAWEAALEFGMQQIAHEAVDRALNGTIVPIYYMGEQVGERRVFNESGALNLMLAADRIGRHHVARDFACRNWVDMVRRVGEGPLIWTEEELADAKKPATARDIEAFIDTQTHYPPQPPAPPKRGPPRVRML
jgi:hypothetical protein